jgi:hypothetical protein
VPSIEHWNVDDPGVWREKVDGETVAVRHPAYPAQATWTDGDPDTLQQLVARYLAKVEDALDLPGLLDASGQFALPLVWLPLLPDADGSADPRASFLVTRREHPLTPGPLTPSSLESSPLVDATAVFLAVESMFPNDLQRVLGSRLGIRIVAEISGLDAGNVRITSATRSTDLRKAIDVRNLSSANEFLGYYFAPGNFNTIKADVGRAAGLDPHAPFAIDGLRIRTADADRTIAECYANVPRQSPDGVPYALTAGIVFDLNGSSHEVVSIDRSPLVAHAVQAHLFTRDPASKAGVGKLVDARPNRSSERLAGYRDLVTLEGIMDMGGSTQLLDDLDLVKITKSRLVEVNADEGKEEDVKLAGVTGARINSFAALGGYERVRAQFDQHHARPLVETIIEYGLSPFKYFKYAVQPLRVRYRGRIRPGPGKDGKTVNAQVDFDPPGGDFIGMDAVWDPSKRRPLEVRFALADLQRSGSRRDPLGLAADPRWSWHEYYHVLLAARTSLLELPFAHSAGDALAAITADPWSELATHLWLRGYTYPWVYLHRRHDRSVYDGWGWSGRYHRPDQFPPADNRRHKGYQSEQILSTTLFRLYRALGGDAVLASDAPDRPARQRAADYVVYMILRAIRKTPPAPWGVPTTPDQLVTQLTSADTVLWPVGSGPLKDRVGGWAHKVVRWAFEAQGLYATTSPSTMVDAPGKPPDVDVFIDNGRPDSDGNFPRGGYMPVSLDWHPAPNPSRWHASPTAVQIDAAGNVRVRVRNRGAVLATGVTVSVWWIDWPAGDPPKWDPTTWTPLPVSGPKPVPPWPNPPVAFGPFALPFQPSGRRLILAAATCAADRANIDPLTSLHCATLATPIADLVAGDNNLGLRLRVMP